MYSLKFELLREKIKSRITTEYNTLNLSDVFVWDVKNKIIKIEKNLEGLEIDLSNENNFTIHIGSDAKIKVGDNVKIFCKNRCVIECGVGCYVEMGHECDITSKGNNEFKAKEKCKFKTEWNCSFSTWSECIFNTDSGCTFNTMEDCKFEVGNSCDIKTGNWSEILCIGKNSTIQCLDAVTINKKGYNTVIIIREDNEDEYYSEENLGIYLSNDLPKEHLVLYVDSFKVINKPVNSCKNFI